MSDIVPGVTAWKRFPIPGVGFCGASDDSQPQVNVLFITADQWRGDCLGAAGHPVVRTPNLDRLAAAGVSFRRHFAKAAPCGPSRASLYTGMYLMNHRSALNGTPLDARHDNVALVARRLGYEPALFGYTDTSIDPRTVRADDPALYSYEGVLPGFDPVCHLPEGAPDAWLEWMRRAGVDVPDDGARSSTSPRPDRSGARSTTPKHRRPRSSPIACSTSSTSDARAKPAVVRAPLVPAPAPAVPRARAVRHDVRPRVGSRARARADARPRKARSIRCSA